MLQSAIALQREGRWAEAEQIYRQVLTTQPGNASAWFEFGNLLASTGRLADASAGYRNAIAAKPDFAEAYCNLGNASKILGDTPAAKNAFERAVQLRPTFAEAWNNLGNIAQDQGNDLGAIPLHQRAIELRPDFVQAWFSLGGAMRSLKRLDDALAAYDRALQLQPRFDKAEVNRSGVLQDLGRQQEAIDGLARAMEFVPKPETLSNLIYIMPFHPAYDAAAIWPRLRQWDALFAQPLTAEIRQHLNVRDPERRLRIGYSSPDFYTHPIGRFALPLLEHHDHAAFEIFCYSNRDVKDSVNARTRAAADHFLDVTRLSDSALTARIREDQIDILVDLTAHTAGNRLLTLARKPAPIQVNWLSYPGTTGVTAIDYRISDRYLDPPGDQQFYSEKTLVLPDCFWIFDPLVDEPIEVEELPAASAGYINFGSLNNFAKVTDPTIDLWADVLSQVPHSRLSLLGPTGAARGRFESDMASRGVMVDRITWLERMPRAAYLAAHHHIDIMLDTFPCSGHTTTFDAIWMGVPVMTLAGRTAFSRGSLSVLSNLGLDEWIAHRTDEFVQKVTAHAADVKKLADLRRSLRLRIEKSALMDKPKFARSMEALYRQIWRNWCRQQ